MTLQDFIKKRKYLIWYVKDYDRLSDAAIVEAILNYGNWEDVQTLFKILGIKKTAKIFSQQVKQPRCNYYPQIVNYFKLYFQTHA